MKDWRKLKAQAHSEGWTFVSRAPSKSVYYLDDRNGKPVKHVKRCKLAHVRAA